jgi:hypothetical protein
MRYPIPMAVALLFLSEVATRSDALAEWEMLNPPVTSGTLTAATYGAGRFPRRLQSACGAGVRLRWSLGYSSRPHTERFVRRNLRAGVFVAVGDFGTVLVSSNGTLWTNVVSASQNHLYAIMQAEGLFVAVGSNGTIVTSSDALSWTLQASGTSNQLSEVAFGANAFITVGAAGTIRRSVDGVIWTHVQNSESNALTSVTYGNGQFVAVGEAGIILQSSDGLTWSRRNSVTNSLNAVTYGNDIFVAVGDNGTIVSSPDGMTWMREDSGVFGALYTVAYGNGCFLAGGAFGVILTSLDGISWDIRNQAGSYYAIAFNEDTYVAVGSYGKYLPQPIAESAGYIGTPVRVTALMPLSMGMVVFVAVGNNGLIVISADGVQWIQRSGDTSERFLGITLRTTASLQLAAAA